MKVVMMTDLEGVAGVVSFTDQGYADGKYYTLTFYGAATLIPPGDPRQDAMRWRIIRRYYDTEADARRYYESVRDEPSALIVITAEKVITQDFNTT